MGAAQQFGRGAVLIHQQLLGGADCGRQPGGVGQNRALGREIAFFAGIRMRPVQLFQLEFCRFQAPLAVTCALFEISQARVELTGQRVRAVVRGDGASAGRRNDPGW